MKFTKVFGGNSIRAHRVELALRNKNIRAIVKNETESARSASFGSPLPEIVEIYV